MAHRPDDARSEATILVIEDGEDGDLAWDEWVATLQEDEPVELPVAVADVLRQVREDAGQ